jgi:hypothetical protein
MEIAVKTEGNLDDASYSSYIQRMSARVYQIIESGQPLFKTSTPDLFSVYLDTLPQEDRQYHNCSCCRHFINRFGGLVTISDSGLTSSVMWEVEEAPDYYRPVVTALRNKVNRAGVVSPFLSSDEEWGDFQTGQWTHFAVRQPRSARFFSKLMTPGQKMAEKREDFKNVSRALSEFTKPMVAQALKLCNTDSLYRSEKVLGNAQWLHDLHEKMEKASMSRNVLWKEVALAPAGFCHVRSSMIGTLLEDIASGMAYDDVARRFKDKMHPLQYQRPQAAPTEGNIKRAEEIVAKLGIAPSLERRFATLADVQQWVWVPKEVELTKGEGVFSHLKPKNSQEVQDMKVPPVVMTWEKFNRTVLLDAESIQFYVRPGRGPFTAMVTAVHPDAPPILLWDNEEHRNPVSTYVWNSGSPCEQWGLRPGWVDVTGITKRPHLWSGEYPNQTTGVIFLLKGATESRNGGLALFPEILKSELREVRSVIEAHSRSGEIAEMRHGNANGVGFDKGKTGFEYLLRVTSKGQTVDYKLDRWD